tara:strand:- start:218 stop:586 length:369 start_codon:yes stop_codon:yes gene_type:complete
MSFIDDLIKATKAGGASSMTKPYKVKKNDTLSTIAKANGVTLKQLMKINPKFETGKGKGSPTAATIEQKMMKPGSTIRLPDPKTFKNFKLQSVKQKSKPVYKKINEKDLKEMNVSLKKKKVK